MIKYQSFNNDELSVLLAKQIKEFISLYFESQDPKSIRKKRRDIRELKAEIDSRFKIEAQKHIPGSADGPRFLQVPLP